MKKDILILGIAILLTVPMTADMTGMQKAEAFEIERIYEASEFDEGIVPYADVIVTKFRVINGVTQYRRWNETKGYWVDSDWITP